MRIISGVVPGVSRLARLQELSKKARQRLKWFDYYNSRGHNARLTCRHFDISPQTFYRWKRRYNAKHPAALEDCSHRPKHLRQPTYSVGLVEAVLRLGETYPRWSKDKLTVLLHGEPHQALGYLTPQQFLALVPAKKKGGNVSLIM